MIIAISGSVGSGKTTISKQLATKLNFEIIHLNELAQNYKLEQIEELDTFDFDLDKLLDDLEEKLLILRNQKKDIILEGHFAHFINPEFVDFLFIINRDLVELKQEYKTRKYNKQKIEDNLEVESFNLCFYEALEEGYMESGTVEIGFGGDIEENILDENLGLVYSINNCSSVEDIVDEIAKIIRR